jgi:beta-xylosidase/acetyl esterase/lipase
MKRVAVVLLCGLQMTACGTGNPYTAQSTYQSLVAKYPFIHPASDAVPATVRTVRSLTYAQPGGRALQLDLYLPATPQGGAVPAVIFVHGGGWRVGERRNFAPMAIAMAQRGYAAATISYRLSPEAQYPAAIHDAKAAVRWVRANAAQYGIDAGRIAIAGGSAGGQIASLVGVTNGVKRFDPDLDLGSSAVQAIINIDGLSDFTSEAARLHEDDPAKKPSAAGAWFGGRYAEQAALWHEASPTFHVRGETPPILFIGSAQSRFSVGRDEMVTKLRAAGVTTRVVSFPDTPHSFWLLDPWLAPTVEATVQFLDEVFARPAWMADRGDGSYQNPILHADYSDPDVIRVGDMFYMTSSSFSNTPGLPLLQSHDMVNWELVGHALPQLEPAAAFATPQYGKGVWAPCLRFHDGRFWIFYPDPDQGIFVMTASSFAGPWTKPHLLLPGKGIIDPTPLWDDDGKAYLLHAWAKSRAGINNMLTLRRMAVDGRSLLDAAGEVVIDGNQLPGYKTLEGPKLYKHEGYYYVFAPAGGVESGWQSVFRSRHITGPYEGRIVMAQGRRSPVNGPHQGAWVRAKDGKDWFFHFQDKRAYGRVVHLQPMRWHDGWPVIGEDLEGHGVGQPVAIHAKPIVHAAEPGGPATSDEFTSTTPGLQWQWNANWDSRWFSLSERPGQLRLRTQPAAAPNLRSLPSLLTQKLPAASFVVNTVVELNGASEGDRAGLILLGQTYAWLGVRQTPDGGQIVLAACTEPAAECREQDTVLAQAPKGPVYLRMRVREGGVATFSYSTDDVRFVGVARPFTASMGRWVGAQMGMFSTGAAGSGATADFDYFRVTR